jgi:Domain of unknown function (DUF1918)
MAGQVVLVMLATPGTKDEMVTATGMAGAAMRAAVGDVLVLSHGEGPAGLVIGVIGRNGAPPYVIKWLSDGHIAMVTPDQYARIIPSAGAPSPSQPLDER